MTTAEIDRADSVTTEAVGVFVPPPLVFSSFLFAGFLLHRLFPFTLLPRGLARTIGAALLIPGFVLGSASVRAMARAGTPVEPNRPTTTLVVSGPYRYSRNPIYLSFALVYAGIAALANSIWPLLLLPAAFVLNSRWMVEREERYLERRFGDRYRRYRERVRRWV